MVGEMRDPETAQIAIQASLTGHLVLTTLHTNDAPGAVTRLIDMGVEPFLISPRSRRARAAADPHICKDCRTAYEPNESLLANSASRPTTSATRHFYYGRRLRDLQRAPATEGAKGIYELLRITDPIRDLINERTPSVVLNKRPSSWACSPCARTACAASTKATPPSKKS